MQRPFPNGHKCLFGCNGYVTAVAAGQSQRLYSGVGIFSWYNPISPPQILRCSGVHLETRGLISGTYNGNIYGGTYSTAKYGLIYIYIYMY
jgi:hypothetical protein